MIARGFIRFNQRLANRIQRRLPHAQVSQFALYESALRQRLDSLSAGTIVDVGGGRACSFAGILRNRQDVKIIAVDISAEEMSFNVDVDECRVADVGLALPFSDESIDLIVSRTVLEHVSDVRRFVDESWRVLKPGAYSVHLIPCRYALFAIIARVIPFRIGRAILHYLRPQSVGIVEFPVFYKDCYKSKIEELHRNAGFDHTEIKLTYFQSDYFDALLPAFILSVLYECITSFVRWQNLAAYMVVIGRK